MFKKLQEGKTNFNPNYYRIVEDDSWYKLCILATPQQAKEWFGQDIENTTWCDLISLEITSQAYTKLVYIAYMFITFDHNLFDWGVPQNSNKKELAQMFYQHIDKAPSWFAPQNGLLPKV